MIRVVIADDHPLIIEGLQPIFQNFSTEIELVACVGSGADVLKVLEREQIDVAILDIQMPGMKDASTLRTIHKQHPRVQVLILTTYADGKHIKQMLQAGARGYVVKNRSGKEVIDAVKTVHDGKPYFSKGVPETLATEEVLPDGREPEPIKITPREAEVLALLADDLGVKQIADRLNISEDTIISHKKNLVAKIGVNTEKGLVRFAVDNGYTNQA